MCSKHPSFQGYCKELRLHSLILYRTLTAQPVSNYVAGHCDKSRLFKTKIFCIILLFFFFKYIFVRRRRRIILSQFSCLLATSRLAGNPGLFGRQLCQVSNSSELAPAPGLLCSSPSFAAVYFSKLFAQTYNNIIFSRLQSRHGAKSLQVPALEILVPGGCWGAQTDFQSWTSEAVYFTVT